MIATVFADLLPSHPGLAGPLQPHIDWFARRLAEQGYTHATAQEKLRLVAYLSHWLQEHQLGAEALDESCIGLFLQDRRQQGRAPRHNRVTLQTFLTGLRDAGMLPVAVRQDSPLDVLARAFDHYLTAERGLAPITRGHYLPIMRKLSSGAFWHRPPPAAYAGSPRCDPVPPAPRLPGESAPRAIPCECPADVLPLSRPPWSPHHGPRGGHPWRSRLALGDSAQGDRARAGDTALTEL